MSRRTIEVHYFFEFEDGQIVLVLEGDAVVFMNVHIVHPDAFGQGLEEIGPIDFVLTNSSGNSKIIQKKI